MNLIIKSILKRICIKINGYSREYLKDINFLGMSYTPKYNMFGAGVVTLLPACILIIDRDGNVMQLQL